MKSYAKWYPLAGRRWCQADRWRCLQLGLSLGLAAATASAVCPPDAADGALVRNGELVLAYRPLLPDGKGAKANRIPLAKHFALEVQLCENGGVSAARLQKADATMPEHRHGMNYRPLVTPLGDGRFRVEGMMFHMAGHWQLVFDIERGKEAMRLVHDVQIE